MNRVVLGALALAGILSGSPAQAGSDVAAMSRHETSWQVRAALNVAALSCRDEAEAETVASYNHLLAQHRASLAAADAGLKAQYRARYGASWASYHDRDMTRLYNFFAQPGGHDGLCAEAQALLAVARGVDPADFADFAAYALPRLRDPFEGAVHDTYRLGETAMRERYAGVIPQR